MIPMSLSAKWATKRHNKFMCFLIIVVHSLLIALDLGVAANISASTAVAGRFEENSECFTVRGRGAPPQVSRARSRLGHDRLDSVPIASCVPRQRPTSEENAALSSECRDVLEGMSAVRMYRVWMDAYNRGVGGDGLGAQLLIELEESALCCGFGPPSRCFEVRARLRRGGFVRWRGTNESDLARPFPASHWVVRRAISTRRTCLGTTACPGGSC